MFRITLLLIILFFVTIQTTRISEGDEVYYVTEMENSTVTLMDTTFSAPEKRETGTFSIKTNDELSTHTATTKMTENPSNATTIQSHTTLTKAEQQSSTSTASTQPLSTSRDSTRRKLTSAQSTVTPITNSTPTTTVSITSTTRIRHFKSSSASLPDSSLKSDLPITDVTSTVGSSKSKKTSTTVTFTPSLPYGARSTTKGDLLSSPVIRSSSEIYSSTVTSPVRSITLTSHVKSTQDRNLATGSTEQSTMHSKSTLKVTLKSDLPGPSTNSFILMAAGAGGGIVFIMGAVCLLIGVRKARKRRFWGSGANGSGIAEIGMKFTKTTSRENGMNMEDDVEVDTGFSFSSDTETEPKAKIKVHGVSDSTDIDRALTTFTPGPENFKRAQDRNLSEMVIVKDVEEDYFGDGDYRDSIAM